MSSKSGIYAVNTSAGNSLAIGSIYSPTTIVRRYGKYCNLGADGIIIGDCNSGAGYYEVDATISVLSSVAGSVSATLYKDGVPITGATTIATATASDQYITLPISALVRLNCNCDTANISVVMGGQATTTFNLAIDVVKE